MFFLITFTFLSIHASVCVTLRCEGPSKPACSPFPRSDVKFSLFRSRRRHFRSRCYFVSPWETLLLLLIMPVTLTAGSVERGLYLQDWHVMVNLNYGCKRCLPQPAPCLIAGGSDRRETCLPFTCFRSGYEWKPTSITSWRESWSVCNLLLLAVPSVPFSRGLSQQ